LRKTSRGSSRILALEEHLSAGGFGSAVLEAFHAEGLRTEGLRFHAIPDQFVEHSPQAVQRANLKLDVAGVLDRVDALFPELAEAGGTPGAKGGVKKESGKLMETVTW